jgi:hypothetical protein
MVRVESGSWSRCQRGMLSNQCEVCEGPVVREGNADQGVGRVGSRDKRWAGGVKRAATL